MVQFGEVGGSLSSGKGLEEELFWGHVRGWGYWHGQGPTRKRSSWEVKTGNRGVVWGVGEILEHHPWEFGLHLVSRGERAPHSTRNLHSLSNWPAVSQ